ncbi:MAG: glycosyltransferase family A protein [Alphaproteobacteria bacterium]|nr:glycosyltransferase family A protein [Alphaproteobacteria bacterium]
MPRVTVFLPCFNAAQFLPRALASLDAQTYRDFEVLVVDDGSTEPETLRYLDQDLPSGVRLIRQENRGLAGARNTGFREARGELVVPLDCDDALAPQFLERTIQTLDATPTAEFAFSHFELCGERRGVLVKHFNAFEQLFLNQLPYCMLQRKRMWAALGGYDESMRDGYEDWEYNIRAIGAGYIGVEVPEPLFIYTVRADGMLQMKSRRRHAHLWRDIQQRNPDQFRIARMRELHRIWRNRPSTRPLFLCWVVFAAHRLIPATLFNALFRSLSFLSSSAQASSRVAPTAREA